METLVLTENLFHKGKNFLLEYLSTTDSTGARRYSTTINFNPGDMVILDDISLFVLRAKAQLLLPFLVEARAIDQLDSPPKSK